MTRFWKGLALFVAIACAVWIVVLWRWQVTSRDMSVRDIVVYLGLLPLAVFGFAVAARWAWRGASERATRQAEARATAAPAAAVAASADEAERHLTVQLLAARLLVAPAESAADLLSAARDGSPRPVLDAELRDDDGLPVMAARIASVDGERLEEESQALLEAVLASRPEWQSGPLPGAHVWRALAALREPLAAAVAALSPWQPVLAVQPQAAGAPPAEHSVRVLLGWPVGWSELEQEAGRAVASAWLAAEGVAGLPDVRFTISARSAAGDELLQQADRLMLTLARAGRHEPVIVAACHSTVGAGAVEQLERDGLLFHAQRRPKGQMPAEAAAALVLAGPEWPAAPDDDTPVPHLHRPAFSRRDKSIDAAGRVGTQTAAATWAAALSASRVADGDIAALAADADQHTDRAAELYVTAADALPQLDAGEDLHAIGHVVGAVGGVGALLVVACAAELARSTDSPCGALCVGDAFARLALVVRPSRPIDVAAATVEAAAP